MNLITASEILEYHKNDLVAKNKSNKLIESIDLILIDVKKNNKFDEYCKCENSLNEKSCFPIYCNKCNAYINQT